MECANCFDKINDDEAAYCPDCVEGPFCAGCAALHECDDEDEYEEEDE
jgi:hypothetical protein